MVRHGEAVRHAVGEEKGWRASIAEPRDNSPIAAQGKALFSGQGRRSLRIPTPARFPPSPSSSGQLAPLRSAPFLEFCLAKGPQR